MFETRAEIGSRTAKEGFNNEEDLRTLFSSWKQSDTAKDMLKSMGFDLHSIKHIDAIKKGGKSKTDIQLRVKLKDSTQKIVNLSLKKQNLQGYNHIGRTTVDNYCDLFGFSEITRRALKKYCGVKGFTPEDLLSKGEISKEKYLSLREVKLNKQHTESGRRFFIDELEKK